MGPNPIFYQHSHLSQNEL